MRLSERIRRLKVALSPLTEGLIMPDGRVIQVLERDFLSCIGDAAAGRETPTLALVRKAVGETGGGELVALIKAIDAGKQAVKNGGEKTCSRGV